MQLTTGNNASDISKKNKTVLTRPAIVSSRAGSGASIPQSLLRPVDVLFSNKNSSFVFRVDLPPTS